MLDEGIKKQLKEIFEGYDKKVNILLLTQPDGAKCQYCKDTEELYTELAGLTDKIELEIHEYTTQKEYADKAGLLQETPVTIIRDGDKNDLGIRFYGIPAGYEFSSLLETLTMVSTGHLHLKKESIDFIQSIDKPVDLKVFVTTSCPYCPAAVFLGHQFAYLNKNIVSSMIEASEFPQLSNKYNVMGVPRTVIQDKDFQEGAAPEDMMIEKIKKNL